MIVPGSANALLLASAAPTGYNVERSLRFNSADSAYLSRTPASAGNRKTWTWSGWVKRSKIDTNAYYTLFGAPPSGGVTCCINIPDFNTGNGVLEIKQYISAYNYRLVTTQVFRDPSAWYHIVVAFDTTQATASDRIKVYVNGVQITSFSTAIYPTQNFDGSTNNSTAHDLGRDGSYGRYWNGYLADIHFIDGQALDPTSFTEVSATTGQLIPKAYAGSYGTNGFHLPFSDNSTAAALGTDTSGNSNTWTVNNISNVSGGPTSVAAASGALPIYNTTDTYGTTKGTGTRVDSNSSSIVLAIPMDGANNGTTFTDESATIKGSGSAKTITRNGDTKTNTAQSKFYGSSGYFDGTGDYLNVASSNDFAFGTNDFTVELWYYHISGNDRGLFANNSGSSVGVNFLVGAGGPFRIYNGTSANNLVDFSASPSANTWQHLAVVRSGGTVTLYVNGIASGTANWSGVNAGNSATFSVGAAFGDARFAYGYIQDFRAYKGVAKYTSNFNPPSSTQNPTVAAGNDSLVDTPTSGSQVDTGLGGQVTGNYCTLNPLSGASTHPLGNGNLEKVSTSGSGNRFGTIGITSGKFYWENAFTVIGSGPVASCGISSNGRDANNISELKVYETYGTKYNGSSSSAYGASWGANDVIGIAFDADNGTLTFYKNGVSQGTAFTGLTGLTWFPVFRDDGGYSGWINFGQRPFAYTAPSGYKALCDTNLPAPVVAQPSTVMDVKLYTGNSSTQTISGLGFSPDFVWIKGRNYTVNHILYDAIRGSNKHLESSTTASEYTTTNALTSFDSTGFTLGSDSNNIVNQSTKTYAAWCWDAGSSTVTNTQGSITTTVRANPSAGFSVATWTGVDGTSTIGHGLNAAPAFWIIKPRSSANNWNVYHTSLGSSNLLFLNNTSAVFNSSMASSSVAPTSTVVTVKGNNAGWDNQNGVTYVGYFWTPLVGYSSFGSYTGNGSATDGPFVFTGMRPRWLLIRMTSTSNWLMFDAVRNSYNVVGQILWSNLASAETSFSNLLVDFLSNGFKVRGNSSELNNNGSTFVYAAFAESPFAYARAR